MIPTEQDVFDAKDKKSAWAVGLGCGFVDLSVEQVLVLPTIKDLLMGLFVGVDHGDVSVTGSEIVEQIELPTYRCGEGRATITHLHGYAVFFEESSLFERWMARCLVLPNEDTLCKQRSDRLLRRLELDLGEVFVAVVVEVREQGDQIATRKIPLDQEVLVLECVGSFGEADLMGVELR